MLKPAFMAATVLLLVILVVLTPRLIGPREDISSLPRLILNYDEGSLVAFVTSLSGTYLYRALYLNVTPLAGPEPILRNATRAMALEERIPLETMPEFVMEVVAEDGLGQFFDLHVTVRAIPGSEGWTFRLVLEPGAAPREFTSRDLMNAPFATLMERRDTT